MGPLQDGQQEALDAEFRPTGLLRSAAFPHAVSDLELRETTLAWVILTGGFAYKIKKTVALSFVDQSTLAKRKALCDEELRLNRRWAGDLYDSVVPITSDADGLRVGGSGATVEFAVKMRQFAAEQELSVLLERGAIDAPVIRAFAVRLADFHRHLSPAPRAAGSPGTARLHDTVLGTLATFLCHLDRETQAPELGALVDWTHDFLHDSLFLLCKRQHTGHIRECHGDLHARNIVYWEGKLVPFDSLEFDPALRWIDVISDVAFLFMDLIGHRRTDLAFDFLNAYLLRSGDYDGVRLLRFYAVYRALVRAMVDELAAEGQPKSRDEFLARGRRRLNTAIDLLEARNPRLIIMHGLSGSGKSFLSARLAEELGAVLVRSDVERKRIQQQTGAEEIHTPQFDERIYAHVLSCAEACLQGGISVIVDAAFLEARHRQMFRSWAKLHNAPFLIVSCGADLSVLESRIERRRQLGIDPSDADLVELRRQVRSFVPLDEAESDCLVKVDTMSQEAVTAAVVRVRDR